MYLAQRYQGICIYKELTINQLRLMFLVYVVMVFFNGSTTDSSIIVVTYHFGPFLPQLGTWYFFVNRRFVNNFSPTIFLDTTSSVNTCLLKNMN